MIYIYMWYIYIYIMQTYCTFVYLDYFLGIGHCSQVVRNSTWDAKNWKTVGEKQFRDRSRPVLGLDPWPCKQASFFPHWHLPIKIYIYTWLKIGFHSSNVRWQHLRRCTVRVVLLVQAVVFMATSCWAIHLRTWPAWHCQVGMAGCKVRQHGVVVLYDLYILII